MSEELYSQFTVLRNFRSAVRRCDVSKQNAASFNAWRNGKKCPEGSPQREEADRLWKEYEKIKDQPREIPTPVEHKHEKSSGRKGSKPVKVSNATAASPSCLGQSFHNPYTFIRFPDTSPTRTLPTAITADELDDDRFTGLLELKVQTLSPLLSCKPDPINPEKKSEHKIYKALAIDDDVILPTTGVRGALRSLMTILAGGNLGYIDEGLWLCQERDVNLGRAAKNSSGGTPKKVFLARVERRGTATRSGTVRLGQTRLVKADDLEKIVRKCCRNPLPRPKPEKPPENVWVSSPKLESASTRNDAKHQWQVKLSGRPINRKGKLEGIFKAGDKIIELGAEFWRAYQGRHRHSDHPELNEGDLVWLEPSSPGQEEINSQADIKSMQWARWGRKGTSFKKLIEKHYPSMLPDSHRNDGLVDEITNLFGQVPSVPGAAGPFAGRIRPENLVFKNSKTKVMRTPLAPLAPPHPGCLAFYRDSSDLDSISSNDKPKGYKVYRTSREQGKSGPWHYKNQGVYDNQGRLKPSNQRVNRTCDLLPSGENGTLRIALRSLSKRELALLLMACAADWRLGGGKPLGLGHCRVTDLRLLDEDGNVSLDLQRNAQEPLNIPREWKDLVSDVWPRLTAWQATQIPVPKLRYPRAVNENTKKPQRGGHVWFQRHAAPRKKGTGLGVLWTDGKLKQQAGNKDQIAAQALPDFDPDNPKADQLYGYDLFSAQDKRDKAKNKTIQKELEPFDEDKHARSDARSGGFHGQNAETRRKQKEQRRHHDRSDRKK